MAKNNLKINRQRAVALIEIIIYVGVLSVMATFLVYSIIGLIQNYKRIQIASEVADNAGAVFSVIGEEIRSARLIYIPTTVLDQDSGQLSLETLKGAPSGEKWTYVDFYLDNKKVYLKREGADPFPITSDGAMVSVLKFTQIGTGTTTSSIRIDLTVSPNLPAGSLFYFEKNFTSTAGLR